VRIDAVMANASGLGGDVAHADLGGLARDLVEQLRRRLGVARTVAGEHGLGEVQAGRDGPGPGLEQVGRAPCGDEPVDRVVPELLRGVDEGGPQDDRAADVPAVHGDHPFADVGREVGPGPLAQLGVAGGRRYLGLEAQPERARPPGARRATCPDLGQVSQPRVDAAVPQLGERLQQTGVGVTVPPQHALQRGRLIEPALLEQHRPPVVVEQVAEVVVTLVVARAHLLGLAEEPLGLVEAAHERRDDAAVDGGGDADAREIAALAHGDVVVELVEVTRVALLQERHPAQRRGEVLHLGIGRAAGQDQELLGERDPLPRCAGPPDRVVQRPQAEGQHLVVVAALGESGEPDGQIAREVVRREPGRGGVEGIVIREPVVGLSQQLFVGGPEAETGLDDGGAGGVDGQRHAGQQSGVVELADARDGVVEHLPAGLVFAPVAERGAQVEGDEDAAARIVVGQLHRPAVVPRRLLAGHPPIGLPRRGEEQIDRAGGRDVLAGEVGVPREVGGEHPLRQPG
jgi:hypothetical protein